MLLSNTLVENKEVRRLNLVALAQKFKTLKALAEETASDAGHLSQVKNRTRNMGDDVARRFERRLHKPPGWMDSQHGVKEETPVYDSQVPVSDYRAAPVVGIAKLGEDGFFDEMGFPIGAGDGFIDAPSRDPDVYALRVKGDSMNPAIRDGWYVVIEPNSRCVVGEYVVAALKDGRKMVKELLWEREDSVALNSVNDGRRITLERSEIESLRHVAFIAPPSKRRL